jgi:glycosyltransferase involved in cell wall biosynthesis
MRIAHFLFGRCNPDSANGVEKTVYNLCLWQARSGHEVALLQLTPKPPLPIPGVHVRSIPPARRRFALPAELPAELDAFAPDVVHLHSAMVPENWSVARLCGRRAIPFVVTPNGNYSPKVLATNRLVKQAFRHFFDLPVARRAAFVHSVGDTDAIRAFGFRGPVIEAPNGVEVPTGSELQHSRNVTRAHPPTLVYIGRLHIEQKGLDTLLRGFALTRTEVPEARLIVAGPDWKGGAARLAELARTLHLGDSVRFVGPVFGPEKADLLDPSSVFVHVSRWEGLSLGVLEALSRSMLVVLSPAADPLGLVGETGAGIVCGSGPEAVALALRQALTMPPQEAERRRRRALRLASERFSWRSTSETVVRAYQTLAGTAGAQREP